MWCAMNLSWVDSTNGTPGGAPTEEGRGAGNGAGARVAKLRALGFDRKLAMLQDDPDLDVRDRAKTALEMMDRCVDEMKT